MVTKVISGGQTGIDQMGLRVAKSLGIPTGGTAPKGFMTELGPYPSLATDYGLVECTQPGYPARTEQNVIDSDVTVWFGENDTAGYICTTRYATSHGRNHISNPTVEQLISFLSTNNVKVLNVAGNRGSKVATQTLLMYDRMLRETLTTVNQLIIH